MAILALDDLEVIEVTGSDRLDHLDKVTSQRLDDVRPGEVRGALILDPHGAPLAMFWIVVHAERLALLAPPAAARHLLDVTAKRTFLADVQFAPVDTPVHALYGPDVDRVLRGAGVAGLTVGSWRPVVDGLVVRHAFGVQLIGADLAETFGARDDVTVSDTAGLAAARVVAGEPVFGREVVAPHLPEEAGVLPTHVHLDKGCYPGQEAVARMWVLGRPRRRLVRARVLTGTVAPGWTSGEGRDRVEVTAVSGDAVLAHAPSSTAVGDVLGDTERLEVVALVGAQDPPGTNPAVTRRRDKTA